MTIEKGMIFRSTKSGREIEILKADGIEVRYRDLKYGTVFTFPRKSVEQWVVEHLIEEGELRKDEQKRQV